MVQASSMAGGPQVLQWCWAHQIREVDVFVEEPEGKDLSEAIYEKFKALKGVPRQRAACIYGKVETVDRSIIK